MLSFFDSNKNTEISKETREMLDSYLSRVTTLGVNNQDDVINNINAEQKEFAEKFKQSPDYKAAVKAKEKELEQRESKGTLRAKVAETFGYNNNTEDKIKTAKSKLGLTVAYGAISVASAAVSAATIAALPDVHPMALGAAGLSAMFGNVAVLGIKRAAIVHSMRHESEKQKIEREEYAQVKRAQLALGMLKKELNPSKIRDAIEKVDAYLTNLGKEEEKPAKIKNKSAAFMKKASALYAERDEQVAKEKKAEARKASAATASMAANRSQTVR